MNKKAFTLIELLAVIVLLAIIMAIATPNVLGIINNNKNEQYITFAKELISKGKYYYTLKEKYEDLFSYNDNCASISASDMGLDNEKDPDNGNYDLNNSKVLICIENSTLNYYVKVIGSKKSVMNIDSSFVKEEALGNSVVINN